MNATAIRRVTPADLEHPASPRAELALKASTKLGYNNLARRIQSTAPLMETLVKLDMLPLKLSSVEKYKKSKEKTTMWSGYKAGIYCSLVFIACIPAFSWLLQESFILKGYTYEFIASVIGTVTTSIVGVVSFIMAMAYFFSRNERGERQTWRWSENDLSLANTLVPDFILSKALQIKEVYPAARFSVESLVVSEERTQRILRRDPDPFLIVWDANEKYYLDVWDERQFEDTL